MVKTQLIIFWVAVGLYVAASVLYIIGLNFKKDYNRLAVIFTTLGFVANSVATGLRWNQVGHFPYYGAYEVYTSYAWGLALFFLTAQFFKPSLRFIGAFIIPISFIMIGIGIMNSTEMKEIPRTYFTFWLGVHIAFAKLAYGSGLIAAALSVIYLIKERKSGELGDEEKVPHWYDKLPELKKIDYLSYRFVALAFFMLAIMIISGAIWAAKAWGRYWGWDPIETWALVSWLVYGLALHLYRTSSWRGRKMALITIGALILVVFAFFGIPLIYDTAHEHLTVSLLTTIGQSQA